MASVGAAYSRSRYGAEQSIWLKQSVGGLASLSRRASRLAERYLMVEPCWLEVKTGARVPVLSDATNDF